MYQEKVIALLGRTMDRGTTLDEERTSVGLAVKIVKKNNPTWPGEDALNSPALYHVKLAWPLWYDYEGILRSDHEQIRIRVKEAAKAQKPNEKTYSFFEEGFDDIFGHGPWPGESQSDYMRRKAREAEDFLRRAGQAARERERQKTQQQRRREEDEAQEAARKARERAERDRQNKQDKDAAEAARNEKARRAAQAKSNTIGGLANKLLMQVVREYNGVKWGWSYMEIYEKIAEAFPGAKTSLSSLRWYETKLRRHYGKENVPRRTNDWAG